MNFNKVFVLGNVTRDPELRSLPSGQSICTFGVATSRILKGQTGERQQQTEFHSIVTWGRIAEIAHQYLKKGSLVFIEGRIQTRTWTDKNSGEKKYRTEIIAESMQLGPRSSGTAGSAATATAPGKPVAADETVQPEPPTIETVQYPGDEDEIKPEDIPF